MNQKYKSSQLTTICYTDFLSWSYHAIPQCSQLSHFQLQSLESTVHVHSKDFNLSKMRDIKI